MSCCGQKRASAGGSLAAAERRAAGGGGFARPAPPAPPAPPPPESVPPGAAGAVLFRYTGDSRLVVEGPFSRRRYFFAEPGAEQAIDRRDAPSLAGVPVLERLG